MRAPTTPSTRASHDRGGQRNHHSGAVRGASWTHRRVNGASLPAGSSVSADAGASLNPAPHLHEREPQGASRARLIPDLDERRVDPKIDQSGSRGRANAPHRAGLATAGTIARRMWCVAVTSKRRIRVRRRLELPRSSKRASAPLMAMSTARLDEHFGRCPTGQGFDRAPTTPPSNVGVRGEAGRLDASRLRLVLDAVCLADEEEPCTQRTLTRPASTAKARRRVAPVPPSTTTCSFSPRLNFGFIARVMPPASRGRVTQRHRAIDEDGRCAGGAISWGWRRIGFS